MTTGQLSNPRTATAWIKFCFNSSVPGLIPALFWLKASAKSQNVKLLKSMLMYVSKISFSPSLHFTEACKTNNSCLVLIQLSFLVLFEENVLIQSHSQIRRGWSTSLVSRTESAFLPAQGAAELGKHYSFNFQVWKFKSL